MMKIIIIALLAAGSQADVKKVWDEEEPSAYNLKEVAYPECSSYYRINLGADNSNQGNDLSHSPVHGKDTTQHRPAEDSTSPWPFEGEYDTKFKKSFGRDWVGEPHKTNSEKQARAKSMASVTALTEDDATPLGFHRSNLHMYYGVCVEVVGIKSVTGWEKNRLAIEPTDSLGPRWLEIMAQTAHPDQQICVKDIGRADTQDNPTYESCASGDLITCRESTLTINRDQNNKQWPVYPNTDPNLNRNSKSEMADGSVLLKFFCRDTCDDSLFSFYWRISASQEVPKNVGTRFQQPDGENWCGMRDGTDFPSSLLKPYPRNYVEPPVFEKSKDSSAFAVKASALVSALVAVFALFV